MIEKTFPVTLLDGVHILKTPTYFGVALMEDSDLSLAPSGAVKLTGLNIAKILAALLTDAEELDARKQPEKEWTAAEAGRLIPTDTRMEVQTAVVALYASYFSTEDDEPAAEESGSTTRPTSGRSRSAKKR